MTPLPKLKISGIETILLNLFYIDHLTIFLPDINQNEAQERDVLYRANYSCFQKF